MKSTPDPLRYRIHSADGALLGATTDPGPAALLAEYFSASVFWYGMAIYGPGDASTAHGTDKAVSLMLKRMETLFGASTSQKQGHAV